MKRDLRTSGNEIRNPAEGLHATRSTGGLVPIMGVMGTTGAPSGDPEKTLPGSFPVASGTACATRRKRRRFRFRPPPASGLPAVGESVPIHRPSGAKSGLVICPSLFRVFPAAVAPAGTPSRARNETRPEHGRTPAGIPFTRIPEMKSGRGRGGSSVVFGNHPEAFSEPGAEGV